MLFRVVSFSPFLLFTNDLSKTIFSFVVKLSKKPKNPNKKPPNLRNFLFPNVRALVLELEPLEGVN